MRYRVVQGTLIVTKPDGAVVQRDVQLYYDTAVDTFGIRLVGESPLKGYAFDVRKGDFDYAKESGLPMQELPPLQ